MNKLKWNDIAELIGLFAVVASLIVLSYQIWQTQIAMKASTFQNRAFDAIAEEHFVSESAFLLPILVKTNYGDSTEAVANLDKTERARLFHFLRSRMIDWDNEFYQYQKGLLDPGFFEATTVRSVKIWAPRWRAIGLSESRIEFKEFIDKLLAK